MNIIIIIMITQVQVCCAAHGLLVDVNLNVLPAWSNLINGTGVTVGVVGMSAVCTVALADYAFETTVLMRSTRS